MLRGEESTWNTEDTGQRVQSLGGEEPLEKEMTTHSSILLWRISWTEEPGGLYTQHILMFLNIKVISACKRAFVYLSH